MGPVFFDNICQRYGQVLLNLQKDILPSLEEFYQWVSSNEQRWALAKEPMLPVSWWSALYGDFLRNHPKPQEYPQEAQNTLTVLYERGRLRHLPAIINYIKEERCPTRKIYVYCYQKTLPKKEEEELLGLLGPLLDKPGEIHVVEDPEVLLGGVVLWNHWMIDCSLSSVMSGVRENPYFF